MRRQRSTGRTLAHLACALALIAAAGCGKTSEIEWQSPIDRGHPLVGRVWDVAGARFIGPRELVAHLARARFVLLGETHDNPDHHALQARLVRDLFAAGRRPAVGFEMFSTDQAAAIKRYRVGSPRSAAGLGDAVDWSHSGWPAWRYYEPIAQAAFDAGVPVVATNLSRAALTAMRRNGLGGLGPAMLAQLKLETPLPPPVRAAMAREIEASHCGQAPAGALERMVDIQWTRDARMAEALAREGARDGAVLIAGAGHVRRDRGVPSHLARHAPRATVASLAFLEVDPQAQTPADYADRFDGVLPFDVVWFTPTFDDRDPCETFKKAFERLKKL